MTSKEAIIKLYEKWIKYENDSYTENETLDTYFSEQGKKCIFLSSAIVGIITDDDDLSAEFGKMILDTLVQIKNRTTFEYIKDEINHKNFILSCNFIRSWLEWGTSIRGAWFNTPDGEIITAESFSNINYEEESIKITDDFMNWFIDWLSN
jgi:hypothetical protein